MRLRLRVAVWGRGVRLARLARACGSFCGVIAHGLTPAAAIVPRYLER